MCDKIQVLTETFFISNESCVFTYDGKVLQWRDNTVHVKHLLTVDYVHVGNCCSVTRGKFLFRKTAHACRGHDTILIRYAQCQKKNKLKLSSVKIQGDNQILSVWLKVLTAALEKTSACRPKTYLVLINPFSGRKNGLDLYMKKVKPIFDFAKIETCEVVTKCRGDFEKVICSGVDCYDAILAVGGDGTVSEIVNCLIKSQTDMILKEEEDLSVPKIQIPIAIIPCGSTDCVAFTLNGTRDPETNALYAVLGTRSCFDVCRAISQNGLCRFFISVFTYGYLSDLIQESEKFRWMGPIRYNYAGLLTLLRSKGYYGQLDLCGEQCMARQPCQTPTSKKSVKKNTSSTSLCNIPFVPTIEPGLHPETNIVCSKKLKNKNRSQRGKGLRACESEVQESFNNRPKSESEAESGDQPKRKGAKFDDEPKYFGEEQEEKSLEKALDERVNYGGDVRDSKSLTKVCKQIMTRETYSLSMSVRQTGKVPKQLSIKGRYFLIACANISCSSELTPNGIAPNCAPGDGSMNVVLLQPNSICDLYKIYARLTSKDRSLLLSDLPFVKIYKTKQVRINVSQMNVDKVNAANCDGELFHDSVVDIRLYEGIVQFFTRG